jgi:hypothetical protein
MATSPSDNWRNEMQREDRVKVCAMPPLRRDAPGWAGRMVEALCGRRALNYWSCFFFGMRL